MQKNAKILIAAFGVLGLMLSQQSEAETAKNALAKFFSKITAGIGKANTVLTAIGQESNTAKTDKTFDTARSAVRTANTVLEKATNTASNLRNANGSLFNSTLQEVAAGTLLRQNNSSGIPTYEQLKTEFENLEVLRQKAQAAGASIQDKVNYLNAYSSFSVNATTYKNNINAELQGKAAEYNKLKSEYDEICRISTSADSSYAASQSTGTGSPTPIQQTAVVPSAQSLRTTVSQ